MTIVHLTAVFFSAMVILYQKAGTINFRRIPKKAIYILVLAAFVLRMVISVMNQGFPTDIACFYSWANMAYEGGLSNFYTSGTFTDYPPGYIYILYALGFVFSTFKIEYLSGACLLILKLPAILCDAAAGVLIYKTALKKQTESRALLISALYLLNPAVILNSSVWGQVDAVMGFLLFLMCDLLMDKKMIPAYLVFGIGVLVKPQMLIFTPLLIYGILENVILKDFDKHNFLYNLFGGLSVILGMAAACLPFGLENIIGLYTETMSSYPYVSVNAYNFWALIGKNWASQDDKLLFFTYQTWGTINIVLIVMVSAILFYKARRKESRYFTTGAFIMISMFLFSVRMHERYLFPVMALLLFAYAARPLRGFRLAYLGVTLAQLYNTAEVLFLYSKEGFTVSEGALRLISAGMVLVGVYFYYKIFQYDIRGVEQTDLLVSEAQINEDSKTGQTAPCEANAPRASKQRMPFTRMDAGIILAITLIYSVFALYDLGDTDAPQTEYHVQKDESMILEIPEGRTDSWLYWYLGYLPNIEFLMEYRTSGEEEWQKLGDEGIVTMHDVFKWEKMQLPVNCRFLRMTCRSDQASIMELSLADSSGAAFLPQNVQDYPALFDENELFPSEGISFRNGTYFDEIYHARTGYEFLHGLFTYETTHPPFGKVLISLGIAMFGMTPFGWRIVGTVIGILMLPVIYLFARDISKSRWLGGFACILLAFDFMHFAQTRIATIDVYVTFFILLMYYLMYLYTQMSFYDTPLRKTFLPLGACGVTMGFAIASKWTGIYAAVGLAVVFFASLYRRYQEYCYAKKNPSRYSNGIRHKDVVKKFQPYTKKTIQFCLVFFVAIPALIYVLSYIPFKSWDNGLLNKMWNNQISMLSYHSNLEAEHPFSSFWYEWPTMIRPILYFSQSVGETARQSISAFGNPLVWWAGMPAFVYMLYLAVRKKDRNAIFLCVGYLAEYLPWCLVSRVTFIYHYFPSVPFVVLMLMYCAKRLRERLPKKGWQVTTALYAAAVIGMFLMFYPVLSGQTVETQYVDTFLRWMESWVL